MDYLDKFKTYDKYGRRSLYEILTLNPNIPEDWEIIKTDYTAEEIQKVTIDGDDFTNYGDFKFIWEKSYVKEPKRSANGTINNLNSYATFITPHLIIDFSIMSIDDYRAIMMKDLSLNEFIVECYDPIYNKKIKNKMYFATQQMAKLYTISRIRYNQNDWEEFVELVGVQEYSVEMIGTNASIDLVSVIYNLNPPALSDGSFAVPDSAPMTEGEPDVYMGEQVILGTSTTIPQETFGGQFRFSKWNIYASNDDPKYNYINGNAYTINAPLYLYALWVRNTNHILTYNYGIADTDVNEGEREFPITAQVVEGRSIGILPMPKVPSVKYNGIEYSGSKSPYTNGKWYKIPQLTSNASDYIVSNNEVYWSSRDSIIHYLYEVKKYYVFYYVDNVLVDAVRVKYNDEVPLLSKQPNAQNRVFDGWYTDQEFTTKATDGTLMPPTSLDLYGRYV